MKYEVIYFVNAITRINFINGYNFISFKTIRAINDFDGITLNKKTNQTFLNITVLIILHL